MGTETKGFYRNPVWMVIFLALTPGSAVAQSPLRLLDTDWRTDWAKTSIDLAELEPNVPRDAIPSIDSPQFITVSEAERWVGENEPVIRVSVGSETKAYPLQVLIWHEIVNDRIGETPITVTFCPLCYSALVFKRSIKGDEYHFGVSGMLRHSDLVMYDRETHSLWQQLSGEAIAGTFTGTVLEQIPAQIISFRQFKDEFGNGRVLSKETGHQRRYGENPYVGYDDISEKPWLFRGSIDDRLPPMEKVVTVTIENVDKAYPHSVTRDEGVIHDRVGGTEIVIFHTRKGAVSALDESSINRSRTLGSTGVFSPVIDDGRSLSFRRKSDHFVDSETGSTWNVAGNAVSGELAGAQLEPIPHGDIFSFAWFVVKPNTLLYSKK
ncbi:MAG: DUF3179 domain-containing protein [Rhodothermia bacterium]|nr:MAG: DUF3179 domain-containing protein [Rhodothermia bacterium]